MKKSMNLMPVPAQIAPKEGIFRLPASFTIAVKGEGDERIHRAASRMLRRLSGRTGFFFIQDYVKSRTQSDSAKMVVACKRKGILALKEDESYRLSVTQEKIELEAETDLGALRGLETILQLFDADATGYFIRCVEINDTPRFPWRGLLIDVCRHFMPVDVIKRNLDAMAAAKMNVFHWHLTEDQGFRVESKVYPKLHEMGSDGLYYTQEQIKDVIAYASDRGIRVMPEFDMPGHATSWLVGHPELASAPGTYQIARTYGIFDPTMDPTREETYRFLDAFLGEMASLFPDEYFHVGGDENNGKLWDANPEIQKFMKANNIPDNHALQAYFNNRILKILTRYGKKLVGWDEILHPDMPNTIVIQSWRGKKALWESAKQGYMGILSNGYYIDLIFPTDAHYANDPIPENTTLDSEAQAKILGGEATMWAELVTPENIDSRIWPRTLAIAERLWSSENVKDLNDMYRRMEIVSAQLEELGVTHIKNYDMMLRRLTRYTDITALKNLVDILEPIKRYERHRHGVVYTSFSPLTRVVDAARPDSARAREFHRCVSEFLSAKHKKSSSEESKTMPYARIKSSLELWRDNHEKLTETIRLSPILQEIEPLSKDLQAISIAGLEALEYILSDKKSEKHWVEEKLKLLDAVGQPYAETELMVVSGIEKLIRAVKQEP